MVTKFEKDILKIGAVLRIVIWVASYISDSLIDDHDHSSELILTTSDKPELTWVSSLLKCFVRWDGLFYLGFADNDYEYLKNHAFFPLFSRIVQILRDSLLKPLGLFNPIDGLIVCGILLNFAIHLLNIIIFYRLSNVYLRNESLARKSVLLYMISPASVFFSAFYTESIFCLFTFLGYYFLYKDDPHSFKSISLSTVFFILSGFIRSNGNFYIIILGYQLLHRLVNLLRSQNAMDKKIREALQIIGMGIIILIVMNIPYFVVMSKPYQTYCVNFQEYGLSTRPKFCESLLPNAYTYIQDKFWDVGFLTSWQPRKVFFVIWGIPMLVLMMIILLKYYKRNFLNTILLGLPNAISPRGGENASESDAFYTSKNIPTIILTTIMFVINTLMAHINVSSRINSSNPLIYWYAAYSMSVKSDSKQDANSGFSFKNHWVIYYFVFYVVTGCTVFTNFYLFV